MKRFPQWIPWNVRFLHLKFPLHLHAFLEKVWRIRNVPVYPLLDIQLNKIKLLNGHLLRNHDQFSLFRLSDQKFYVPNFISEKSCVGSSTNVSIFMKRNSWHGSIMWISFGNFSTNSRTVTIVHSWKLFWTCQRVILKLSVVFQFDMIKYQKVFPTQNGIIPKHFGERHSALWHHILRHSYYLDFERKTEFEQPPLIMRRLSDW